MLGGERTGLVTPLPTSPVQAQWDRQDCDASPCPSGTQPELGGPRVNPEAAHLDEPVAVGTVVDDGQGLLESGPSNADHVCDQLADRNDDLRDTNTSKSSHLHPMAGSASGLVSVCTDPQQG